MINQFTGVGRITKDMELKQTHNGKAVVNFSIAINRTFTNQNGEREADFINCTVFGTQAENLYQYMGKGSLVGVTGRLQHSVYQNKEGTNIHKWDVVCNSVAFLDSKKDNQEQSYPQNKQSYAQGDQQQQSNNPFQNANGPIDVTDDDLPF